MCITFSFPKLSFIKSSPKLFSKNTITVINLTSLKDYLLKEDWNSVNSLTCSELAFERFINMLKIHKDIVVEF